MVSGERIFSPIPTHSNNDSQLKKLKQSLDMESTFALGKSIDECQVSSQIDWLISIALSAPSELNSYVEISLDRRRAWPATVDSSSDVCQESGRALGSPR